MSVEAATPRIFLSKLLPRNLDEPRVGKGLVDRLFEYQFILNKAYEASQRLRSGDYERFDCIVGESACQIRAIKIAIIASRHLVDIPDFSDRLAMAKAKLDSALTPPQRKETEKHRQSLKHVLDTQQLEVTINPDEQFVIQCYILSEATVQVDQRENGVEYLTSLERKFDHSSPKKILQDGFQISGQFAHQLLIHLKRSVSEASVKYLQQLALESRDSTLVEMNSKEILHDAHNAHLSCVPLFFGMKALLIAAQKELIPIIIHVKFLDQESPERFVVTGKKSLFYKPSREANGSYILSEPFEEDLEKPACVIEGSAVSSQADWRITGDYSITDAILAFFATHSQYPGNHPELEDFNSPELEHYRRMANKNGFSASNPKTLFLQHIYPSKPVKHLNHFMT